MLNRLLRASWTKVMTPIAKAFLAVGLTPDAVTIIGTLAVCVSALAFYPRGEFLTGTLLITLFIFSDNVYGVMARLSGRQGVWGAFLDSTLDRVGDAAIFGGLVLWFAGPGANWLMAGLALACLILGMVVSYAKARAEGLGMTCNVGIAERADRLFPPAGHRPGRIGPPVVGADRRPRPPVRRQFHHRDPTDGHGAHPSHGGPPGRRGRHGRRLRAD
jgi:CDP-diacylglycerol--glycerol-3-phosphate 3-phosphatidyltransferase